MSSLSTAFQWTPPQLDAAATSATPTAVTNAWALDDFHHSQRRTLAHVRKHAVPVGRLDVGEDTNALVVCYDLETTGLSPTTEHIIQIAVQYYVVTRRTLTDAFAQPPTKTYVSYVRTTLNVSDFIQQLTGITPDIVRDAPTWHAVSRALAADVDGLCKAHGCAHVVWVAHNGFKFDNRFIAYAVQQLNDPWVTARLCSGVGRRFWVADTLVLANAFPYKRLAKDIPENRKLGTLAEWWGERLHVTEAVQLHRADGDVRAMMTVLRGMLSHDPSCFWACTSYDTYFMDVVCPQRTCNRVAFDQLQGLHGGVIEWTDEQRRILSAPLDQHTCIIAGAGCAKTTTLLGRIMRLLREGVPAHRILLTTFSRDATDEMLARLTQWVGTEVELVAGTIDAVARRYLRDNDPDAFEACHDVGEYKHAFLRFLQRSTHPNCAHVLDSIDHVLVDEYQDINETYYGIIDAFVQRGARVTAVGDDAQNIYTWNGSDIQYILEFGFDTCTHPCCTYYLTRNFRSTPEILRLANESIARNHRQQPKTIVATQPSVQLRPEVYVHHTWAQEACTLVPILRQARKDGQSVVVLCRNCTNNGPLFFYESVCAREADLPCALLERHNGNRNHVDTDKITLATIHKSKGLEWDVVVVVGCLDKHFPSVDTPQEPSARNVLDEERRLFYVASTRAKKRLLFTYTATSGTQPTTTTRAPPLDVAMTRFLSEVPRSLFTWVPNVQAHERFFYKGDPSPQQVAPSTQHPQLSHLQQQTDGLTSQPLPRALAALSVNDNQRLRQWVRQCCPPYTVHYHNVHDELELPAWVVQEHLYADIERWCLVLLARAVHATPTHHLLQRVLHRVPLTRAEHATWHTMTTTPEAAVTRQHTKLHAKLHAHATRLGVPVAQLHPTTHTHVPRDVRDRLQQAFATYCTSSSLTATQLWAAFEVSWCEPVERGRARFVYQHITHADTYRARIATTLQPFADAAHAWGASAFVHHTPHLYVHADRNGFVDNVPLMYVDPCTQRATMVQVCVTDGKSQTANAHAHNVLRGVHAAHALGARLCGVRTYYPRAGVVEELDTSRCDGEALWRGWVHGLQDAVTGAGGVAHVESESMGQVLVLDC